MTHFYEKNIVDIKNEYITYLTDVLIPLIYEGIQSTYNYAAEQCEKLEELSKTSQVIKNPGVIRIFQTCLKEIPTLSATAIENEVRRIKEFSRCSEWFDDLIKAVVKSHIVLLTYNSSGKTCKLVTEKYHEKINVNELIHKCYIECSVTFFNNPELFWTGHSKETLQVCKTMAYKYIKQSIIDSIHKILPIKSILHEYLSNDYIVDPPNTKTETQQDGLHEHRNVHSLLTSDGSQTNAVKNFEPPLPENGFSLLVSDKEKISPNYKHKQYTGNQMLVESSDEKSFDDKMDEHIKEHLGRIIADDKFKYDDVPNTRQQARHSDIEEKPQIVADVEHKLSPIKNDAMHLGTHPQIADEEELLNMAGGNVNNDKVLSEQGIDKYFDGLFGDN
jgi:hypothetical protein